MGGKEALNPVERGDIVISIGDDAIWGYRLCGSYINAASHREDAACMKVDALILYHGFKNKNEQTDSAADRRDR